MGSQTCHQSSSTLLMTTSRPSVSALLQQHCQRFESVMVAWTACLHGCEPPRLVCLCSSPRDRPPVFNEQSLLLFFLMEQQGSCLRLVLQGRCHFLLCERPVFLIPLQ